MKKILKKLPALMAVVSLALGTYGCGNSNNNANQQVQLTMWMPFEETDTIQPLIDAYTKVHPNVHIVYTKKNIDTYESDLINNLAAGTGPDIFAINNSWLPKYIDKVAPATDKAMTFNYYKNAFVDVAVQDFTRDRKIYGVPLYVDSLALYYNKDLLGSAGIGTPPRTWLELVQDVQKVKRQDKYGYFTVSGAALGTNTNINRAVDILYLMMLQKGTVPYSSDGTTPQFAQSLQQDGKSISPGSDALSFYTSFANPLTPNYNWNYKSDYSIDAFANGRAAFLYSYSYTRQTILQKSPNLNFDVAPVPQPNLDQPAVNFSNYWGEVVSKQSKSAPWAWDFLNFITQKPQLDSFYAKTKYPSARRDLIEMQANDPDIGVFANANLTSKAFYRPDQARMDQLMGQMIDNVILKSIPPDQALQQAEQQAATLRQLQQ